MMLTLDTFFTFLCLVSYMRYEIDMTLQHVSLSFRISTLSNDCGILESIVLICFFFFGFELGAENRFSYIVYNVVLGSCILCA
jgi:hypothetical protein